MRAVIVEDISEHANHLAALLKDTSVDVEVIDRCTNVADAYQSIKELQPDLVFLDIDLEGYDTGFDLLQKFDQLEFSVIFTTQYFTGDVVLNAFLASAVDFLNKPVEPEALERALLRAPQKVRNANTLKKNIKDKTTSNNAIWIKNMADGEISIEIDNIVFCEVKDNYTEFQLLNPVWGKDIYRTRTPLKDWAERLSQFYIYQVHGSYLVNFSMIEKFHKNRLYCKGRFEIPVSKNQHNRVAELWNNYKKMR